MKIKENGPKGVGGFSLARPLMDTHLSVENKIYLIFHDKDSVLAQVTFDPFN